MEFINLEPQNACQKAVESRKSLQRILVCGESPGKVLIEEGLESALESPAEIIDASLRISGEKWLNNKLNEVIEEWEDISEIEGEWPGEVLNKQDFTLDRDIMQGTQLTEVFGLKLDVDEQWHIPAHLRFGGWNDCPLTDVQCAVWKYWEGKYSAVIVGASHDVIEAYVERPPQTQEEAIKLAREQYAYCNDIVDQGVETISVLASLLINGNVWYFWWD